MKIILETDRLLIRELQFNDVNDLFEMDSDPQVHLYIENNFATSISQSKNVIESLQKQYKENGFARWAVVDKESQECLGWSGLKYFREPMNNHNNFYELGYRFKRKHWGKGYATESSTAIIDYAFKNLDIDSIYAITDPENLNSQKVLKKLKFDYIEAFDDKGSLTNWFKLTKKNWNKNLKDL